VVQVGEAVHPCIDERLADVAERVDQRVDLGGGE
jgi:hypothetical protein